MAQGPAARRGGEREHTRAPRGRRRATCTSKRGARAQAAAAAAAAAPAARCAARGAQEDRTHPHAGEGGCLRVFLAPEAEGCARMYSILCLHAAPASSRSALSQHARTHARWPRRKGTSAAGGRPAGPVVRPAGRARHAVHAVCAAGRSVGLGGAGARLSARLSARCSSCSGIRHSSVHRWTHPSKAKFLLPFSLPHAQLLSPAEQATRWGTPGARCWQASGRQGQGCAAGRGGGERGAARARRVARGASREER